MLFDDTSGTVSTTGRFARRMPQADDFRVDYTEGGKSRMIPPSGFRNGTVTRTVNVPPLKKRGSDWVPIERGASRRAVTDPLVGGAGSPPTARTEVCHRTVRIYDGEMRANLYDAWTPHSSGTISVPGYEGPTVVCRAALQRRWPVTGKGDRALEFLKNRGPMHISFAPDRHDRGIRPPSTRPSEPRSAR